MQPFVVPSRHGCVSCDIRDQILGLLDRVRRRIGRDLESHHDVGDVRVRLEHDGRCVVLIALLQVLITCDDVNRAPGGRQSKLALEERLHSASVHAQDVAIRIILQLSHPDSTRHVRQERIWKPNNPGVIRIGRLEPNVLGYDLVHDAKERVTIQDLRPDNRPIHAQGVQVGINRQGELSFHCGLLCMESVPGRSQQQVGIIAFSLLFVKEEV